MIPDYLWEQLKEMLFRSELRITWSAWLNWKTDIAVTSENQTSMSKTLL